MNAEQRPAVPPDKRSHAPVSVSWHAWGVLLKVGLERPPLHVVERADLVSWVAECDRLYADPTADPETEELIL